MDREIEIANLKCTIANLKLQIVVKDRQIEILTQNQEAVLADRTRSLRAENKRLKEALAEALIGRIKTNGL